MSDETKTLYWLQTKICGMWLMVQFYNTLEDARKALRVRAENYKGDTLRIVKETMEPVESLYPYEKKLTKGDEQ